MANNYDQVFLDGVSGDTIGIGFSKMNNNFLLCNVKPFVSLINSLPTTDNTINDIRYVVEKNYFYRWTGSSWIASQSDVSAEVVASRGSAISLQDRLAVALNQDGSLKIPWVNNSSEFPVNPTPQQIIWNLEDYMFYIWDTLSYPGSPSWRALSSDVSQQVFDAVGGPNDTLSSRLDVSIDTNGTIPEIITARGTLANLSTRLNISTNTNGTLKSSVAGAGLKQNEDKSFSPNVARVIFTGRTTITTGVTTIDITSLTGLLATDIVSLSLEIGTDTVKTISYYKKVTASNKITVTLSDMFSTTNSFINYIVYRIT